MFTELLIIFACVLLGIGLSMRAAVRGMLASPEANEDPTGAAEILASVPERYLSVLDSEGFRFAKAYSFHAAKFGIWIQISPVPPLRLFYLSKRTGVTTCEFITQFTDEIGLTTTTTRSAFVFPHPFGVFIQSFTKANPSELWKAHLQGEDFIISKIGIQLQEYRLPFLEGFKRDVIRKLSYVTSLRFWFLRGIYWFFVRRFLLLNRPIWNQDICRIYGRAIS